MASTGTLGAASTVAASRNGREGLILSGFQAHSDAAAVRWNELNAARLQSGLDGIDGAGMKGFAALQPCDCGW